VAAAVIVDRGENELLAAATGGRTFVRLFRNDVGITSASTLDDFEGAAFPGYADIEVTALWTTPVVDAVGRSFSRLVSLTWVRGAGGVLETDYGWVLYKYPAPDSVLLFGQRFAVPYVTNAPGQVILFSLIAYLLRG